MITVRLQAKNLIEELEILGNKHIPFAMARALTWVAIDSQKQIVREMPLHFIIRSNRVLKGIRTTPASKQTMTSSVGSIDDFMELQQTGGIKKPKGTAHNVSTPQGIRSSIKELIPKSKKPPSIAGKISKRKEEGKKARKKEPFWLRSEGDSFLMTRFGTNKKDIKALYIMKKTVKLKPIFGLDKTVYKVVKQRWDRLFELSLDRAERS
jgi:hypothetical protein